MIRSRAFVSAARGAIRFAALVCAMAGGGAALAQTCDPATSPVGAHLRHARDTFARRALECVECHAPACSPVPGSSVVFGALGSANGAVPAWDPASRTCSNVYCHGATLRGPVPATWSYVDPGIVRPPAEACSRCHGYPPPSHDPAFTSCQGCHAPTVLADGSIDVPGGRHINAALDFTGGGSGFACDACHGFPPATGAHLAHFALTDAAASGHYGDLRNLQERHPDATPATAPGAYAFGCGNCHPLDGARHMDGETEVSLYDAAAPGESLKARAAPTAAYDGSASTCSGTYCHSTGQEQPVFATTPGWRSGSSLGCAGCHGNPPSYPSGGAGSASANGHLGLGDDGYEFGHFLGMPGPFHTSKHGGNWATEDAAPITCQTCHYDTVDPSNTGPSGFYYLDTSGSYALGTVDPAWQAQQQCGYCHRAGGAAVGAGRVLPLRHVNGTRDVTFDPRTELPAIAWLPPSPHTPTGPYWMTGASASMPYPGFVRWNGTTVSFDLATATYDRATKTCANVACHMADSPVWGRPYFYLTNGGATCFRCHPM